MAADDPTLVTLRLYEPDARALLTLAARLLREDPSLPLLALACQLRSGLAGR